MTETENRTRARFSCLHRGTRDSMTAVTRAILHFQGVTHSHIWRTRSPPSWTDRVGAAEGTLPLVTVDCFLCSLLQELFHKGGYE